MTEKQRSMTTKQQAKAATEAATPPPLFKVLPKLWHHSNTTDDRRNKRYQRRVRFGVNVLVRDYGAQHKLNDRVHWQTETVRSPFGYARDALDEVMTACPWPVRIKESTFHSASTTLSEKERAEHNNEYECVISFVFVATFHASKPSQIPSEAYCMAALGGADRLGPYMADALERGFETAHEEKLVYERARIASLMVKDYAERVDASALKNVRFEQRYAALVAEYKAELEVQTAELLTELGDKHGVTWSDAPDYVPDERSTKAAKATLPKVIANKNSPAERGSFFESAGQNKLAVDIEDVR